LTAKKESSKIAVLLKEGSLPMEHCMLKAKQLINGLGMILNDKLQRGDTLIEVIVAMVLLALVIGGWLATGIGVPGGHYGLLYMAHTYEIMNADNVVAYNLAESQVEMIKAAPYISTYANGSWYGIGTIATSGICGDPPGQFKQVQSTPINGVQYNIYTQIRWEPDNPVITTLTPYVTVAPDQPGTDYKDIKVEVIAPNKSYPNTGQFPYANYADVVAESRVTAENSGLENTGNNIYVRAEDQYTNSYIGNITIMLTDPASNKYELMTDLGSGGNAALAGSAYFAGLPNTGTYQMTASITPGIGPSGWMVAPGSVQNVGGQQTCNLATYGTTYLTVDVAQASTAIVNFTGPYTSGNPDTFTLVGSSTGYSYPVSGTNITSVHLTVFPDTYALIKNSVTTVCSNQVPQNSTINFPSTSP
jgi:prepilin-type N-terminal cleavage/methylation domain-containing protein